MFCPFKVTKFRGIEGRMGESIISLLEIVEREKEIPCANPDKCGYSRAPKLEDR